MYLKKGNLKYYYIFILKKQYNDFEKFCKKYFKVVMIEYNNSIIDCAGIRSRVINYNIRRA